MAFFATPLVNRAIAQAQNLPGLIRNLEAVSPALAQQLETKPLIASRSPWGTLAAGAVSWLSARYGLGLDEGTATLIAGVGVLAGSYAMRYITNRAINGLISTPPPPPTVTTPL